MTLQDFIIECNLPPDWEPIARMEVLTGCSVCERRLIHDSKLTGGTIALRVYDEQDTLINVIMLCKRCAPKLSS